MRMPYQNNTITPSETSEIKSMTDNLKNVLISMKYENNLRILEPQQKEQNFWSYYHCQEIAILDRRVELAMGQLPVCLQR